MLEQMKWEDVYALWKRGCYRFPSVLSAPLPVETVSVRYGKSGYFYGYDWLEKSGAQERKQLIKERPEEFLYRTRPSNKGTIQTAEMLVEARDEEELAAVWIAATAKELSDYKFENGIGYCADMLYTVAAYRFLSSRYYLWHHAMKRLVPKILIPWSVLENIACDDAEPVMGLIQMNVLLLKSTWTILRYSSLKGGEFPEACCRIHMSGWE